MATDILIEDITTGVVTGTGVFDKLMVAVKAHIQEEYSENRIKGADYANVYLGALQSVLSQSMQFVLQEKQTEAQVDMTLSQTSELLLNGVKDRELKDSQIVGSGYDNQIKAYQLSDILPKEAILLTEQKETADAQQLALAKDLEIKDIQKQVTYVERVIKDKEAATLGMDNAIKIAQASKVTNSAYVYTPQYEEN
jgi:hypothetical protein